MLPLALALTIMASPQEPRRDHWTMQDYTGASAFATATIFHHGFMGEPMPDQDWEVAFNHDMASFSWSDPVYWAMRMKDGKVERVRSTECAFAPMVKRISELGPGHLDIPGVRRPDDHSPGPPVSHARASYVLRASAIQESGAATQVRISANDGTLAAWMEELRSVLDGCEWQPAPLNPNVRPPAAGERG